MNSDCHYLSTVQAAKVKGVDRCTVLRNIKKGVLSAHQEVSGDWRVSPADLMNWEPLRDPSKRAELANAGRHVISQDQCAGIISRYDSGMSSNLIAAELGISKHPVLACLRRGGAKLRKSGPAPSYSVNLDYFTAIDTPEKAYWLGFIAADGCIQKEGAYLSITAARKDEPHLAAFLAAIKSDSPITRFNLSPNRTYVLRRRSNFEYSRVSIHRREFTDGLVKNGVTARKSSTLRMPPIDHGLKRFYVLGYSDGDGGFYRYPKYSAGGSDKYFWSVTSNKRHINDIEEFMRTECDLGPAYRRDIGKNGVYGYLCYGGRRQVGKIARYLYADAPIFLKRKLDRIAPFI